MDSKVAFVENKTRKLTPDEQLEVAKRLAWFWAPITIVSYIKKKFKKDVTRESISMMKASDTWKVIIERFRDDYLKTCVEIPLFNKKKRLEELQEQYDYYKSKGDREGARAIIKDFREEAEGKNANISLNFTQITHTEFSGMTDEQLAEEKQKTLEELSKVRRMKLLTQEDNHELGRNQGI